MHKRDWALVFFTVATQASVGIIICLSVIWLIGPADRDAATAFPYFPTIFALVLVAGATAVSFMHLGSPLNAPFAIRNLRDSWLSREILAINLYITSLVLLLGTGLCCTNTPLPGLLTSLSSLFGLLLIWMMVRIYMLPTIPAWNRWYTPLSFVTTTFSLGFIATLCLHSMGWLQLGDSLEQNLLIALLLVLAVELVSSIIHQRQLACLPAGIQKPVFDHGPYHHLFSLRIGILGALATALIVLQIIPADPALYQSKPVYGLIFLLVMAGEIIGRQMFYSTYYRLGV